MATIRGALFLIYLFTASVLYGLLASPILLFGRSAARRGAQRWCRLILAGLNILCGVRTRIEGETNLPAPGEPAIIAANHQSMWETLALYALLPNPVIIMKRELRRIPIFNFWLDAVGNIAVDRTAGAQAMRSLVKNAEEAFADGAQIIIFPEGTRTPVGEKRPLQPGVAGLYAGAQVACVPVVHDSGRHWLTPGPAKAPGEITLRILPWIAPGLHRKAFLPRLESEMNASRPDLPHSSSPVASQSEQSDLSDQWRAQEPSS